MGHGAWDIKNRSYTVVGASRSLFIYSEQDFYSSFQLDAIQILPHPLPLSLLRGSTTAE